MDSVKTASAGDTFVIQSRALQRLSRDSVRLESKYFPTTIRRLAGRDFMCAIPVEIGWRLRKDDLGFLSFRRWPLIFGLRPSIVEYQGTIADQDRRPKTKGH